MFYKKLPLGTTVYIHPSSLTPIIWKPSSTGGEYQNLKNMEKYGKIRRWSDHPNGHTPEKQTRGSMICSQRQKTRDYCSSTDFSSATSGILKLLSSSSTEEGLSYSFAMSSSRTYCWRKRWASLCLASSFLT